MAVQMLTGDWEAFFGAVDPTTAAAYVRWTPRDPVDLTGWHISGVVRGPMSDLARTLPAVHRLTPLPATTALRDRKENALLAKAMVPDPCFWLPGEPFEYQLEVELRRGGEVAERCVRSLGIRPLGVTGRRLKLAGKNYFPRAVDREAVSEAERDDLPAWRETGAAMIAPMPDDELAREASAAGVLIIANLSAVAEAALLPEVRRLSRWSSVGIVIVPAAISPLAECRIAGRNLLFVSSASPDNSQRDSSLFDGVITEYPGDLASNIASSIPPDLLAAKPILAAYRASAVMSLADAKAACDALQATLAGRIDAAGFAILSGTAHAVR